MSGRHTAGAAPGHRVAAADRHRLAALGRPIAAPLRARALAAVVMSDGLPRVVAGELLAGAPGAAATLWRDTRAATRVLGEDYAREPLQVARAAGSAARRARNDACVPLTHWVCDGLAELEAIAIVLGCVRLGELDAAIAAALDEWQSHGGEAVPQNAQLASAIDGVVGALHALCLRGATGDEALAAVAPIVELIELMRGPPRRAAPLVPESPPLARAAAAVRAAIADHRDELTRLGAAIDRVAAPESGDRIAVALGVAARIQQLAVIAAAIAAWIDGGGATTAAQVRWRAAAAAVEQVFAGTLAGVRRLVPLPP